MRTAASELPLPPGPRSLYPGQRVLEVNRDILRMFERIAARYGDVSRFRVGPFRLVLLNHPDLIRAVLTTHSHGYSKGRTHAYLRKLLGEGLLTSEEPLHLRQRRMIQPLFHHSRIDGYGQIAAGETERIMLKWRPGQTIDVPHEMAGLTISVVGRSLFGADLDRDVDAVHAAVPIVTAMANRVANPLAPILDRLPLSSNRRFAEAMQSLDMVIYRILDERRSAPSGAGREAPDLVSRLLAARDPDDEGGKGMPDRQVRDEVMNFLLAGYETTANVLSWTWYLLARNPEAEAALHEELDRELGDGPVSMADLPRLEQTHRVISESLRLYPPAPMLNREALVDHELGGYRIPAGTIVVISPWVTHRDTRWFPEPERFDLTRWTPQSEAARPRSAYLPFGGGSRMCVGEPFARMEAAIVLATIARRWRLRPVHDRPVDTHVRVTLRPKGPMAMRVEPRT